MEVIGMYLKAAVRSCATVSNQSFSLVTNLLFSQIIVSKTAALPNFFKVMGLF